MIIIAHRGNVDGPNDKLENEVNYVKNAINLGYDVEIDVWWHNDSFFLGHDFPQHQLKNEELLLNKKAWCHAKNVEALEELLKLKNCNCFWHQNDDVTLTTKGYIWTFPGKKLVHNSICVINEHIISKDFYNEISKKCYAVCSDYASILKDYEK